MGLIDYIKQGIKKFKEGGSIYNKDSNTTIFWGQEAEDRMVNVQYFEGPSKRSRDDGFYYEFSRGGMRRRRR